MLKRRDRIEHLNEAIAEAEVKITSQVLLVLSMEAQGKDTAAARRALTAFEGIFVEYLRARAAMIEARELTGRPAGKAREG